MISAVASNFEDPENEVKLHTPITLIICFPRAGSDQKELDASLVSNEDMDPFSFTLCIWVKEVG